MHLNDAATVIIYDFPTVSFCSYDAQNITAFEIWVLQTIAISF